MFSMPAWVNPAPPPQRSAAPNAKQSDTSFEDVLARKLSSREDDRPRQASGPAPGEPVEADATEEPFEEASTEDPAADDGESRPQVVVGTQQAVENLAQAVIEPTDEPAQSGLFPQNRPPKASTEGNSTDGADAAPPSPQKPAGGAAGRQVSPASGAVPAAADEASSKPGSGIARADAPADAGRADGSATKTFETMLGQAGRKSEPAPASPAPASTQQTPEQATADRVATAITTKLLPKGGKMEIRLDPPQLGRIHIDVQVVSGKLTATFTASSDEASRMLGHKLDHLRQSLETGGLTVDRLQVKTSSESSMRDAGADQSHQQFGGQDARQGQSQDQRDLARRLWKRAMFGTDGLDVVG